jgi:hypothetical protein
VLVLPLEQVLPLVRLLVAVKVVSIFQLRYLLSSRVAD